MIEKILELFQKTDFDFQSYANPHDELFYLFDEWNEKYRMKYAICKVIEPKTILEIGVRYGYSAVTFLSVVPDATYLGINTDTDSTNGSKEAIQWAKKITDQYNVNFLIADTQQMVTFPGEFYEFIHITCPQNGDRTIHVLEMALEKGRWILLDGYFSSKENMMSATYFLEKYKQFIDYTVIIPTYTGELLIKTKESAKNIRLSKKNYSDQTIREEYDQTYFLQDCGGYDSYKKFQGKQLMDERLLAAFYLAASTYEIAILDLGCGRGELGYALAQAGASVTGIDYSPSAIAIAKKTFHDELNKVNLRFICDDFLNHQFDEKYDRIIATDFIEHIEKSRYDLALQNVAGLLKPGGLFIVHTSPNALNYGVPYNDKRSMARSIGSYLPKNPRTHYEDLMHINEQTPNSLKKSLEKHFPFSIVWVATAPDIAGSLDREFSLNETRNAQSIFAVASYSPLDPDQILHKLIQTSLNTDKLRVKINICSHPETVAPNEHFTVNIKLENLSEEKWVSLPPNPIHLSYHWFNKAGECIVFDGIRTIIRYPLLPGESRYFSMGVIAPQASGDYILEVTLVQEACFWFENVVQNLPLSLMIKTKTNE